MTVDLETWVSIAVLISTGVAVTGLLLHAIGKVDAKIELFRAEAGERHDKLDVKIDTKIDQVRAEGAEVYDKLDVKIDQVRAEMKAGHSKLEDRLYELAVGLTQRSLIVPPR